MGYKFNPFTGNLDEAGAGGSAAGADTQLQFNSSGAFAGVGGSKVGASGDITLSLNGNFGKPPLKLDGTWITGGTGTTTTPQFLIEPAGTTSTTWSTSGTGFGINAPSGFTGNLFDFQNNGASLLSFYGATAPSLRFKHGNTAAGLEINPQSGGHTFLRSGSNLYAYGIYDDNLKLQSGLHITWASGQVHNSSSDIGIRRSSAGVFDITNGSTGTGYPRQVPVSVSALPAAATVGAGTRGFVSDSTVAASGNFGATVTGGGSNKVPVFSDGTNWRIG